MPLYRNGQPVAELDGEWVLAKDQCRRRVAVWATAEAVQSYGWPQIWPKASSKYDHEGGPSVKVSTLDFQSFRSNSMVVCHHVFGHVHLSSD